VPDHHATIACASYTHARRHPIVLGRIGGWAPPFQLSIAQIVVLGVSFAAMTWTWSAWAPFLPDTVAMVVAAGVPVSAAWALRRVRIEGRSLPRAALGYVVSWSQPAGGTVAGRPYRPGRPRRANSSRMWVTGRCP